jgi:hypothetical protein
VTSARAIRFDAKAAAWAALLLAAPFLLVLAGVASGEGPVAATVLGAAALAAPGAAAMLLPGGGGAARLFARALLGAVVLNVASFALLKLVGVAPGPASHAAVLGALTVALGIVRAGRGARLPSGPDLSLALAAGGAAFALALFAGTAVVPPLEDQDMEVQGTAYGLAHDLEPLCLTNRSTLYFFAHPPLLHLLNAATLTLGDDLETVRPAHAAATAARAQRSPEQRARGFEAVARAWRERGRPRPDTSRLWFREVYRSFLTAPALTGTRAPNFILAAGVSVLLLLWLRRLGVGRGDAALVTLAYATLPEIFVRSGYGGYYALTAATLLAAAWLSAGERAGRIAGGVSGFLAILANQKALVVGVGATLARFGVRLLRPRPACAADPPRDDGWAISVALPLWLGIAVGGAAFWVYGLIVAPSEFVSDHLLEHGVRRLAGGEALTHAGQPTYPTRAGLWLEFAGHMGWAWTALAFAALLAGLETFVRGARGGARAAGRERVLAAGVLCAWVLAGTVVFTLTDWRQTKHLCLLVPALAALVGALFPLLGPRSRLLLRVALLVSLVGNGWWIVKLAQDFPSFPMSTIW